MSARYVTLSGFPLRFDWQWPVHASQSGIDWFSLHGRVWLDDASGLHADVAVNLTATIKESLPSLAPEHAESAAVNAVRKALDTKQIELLKSGKLQPVPISSRHYDFKSRRLIFLQAQDAEALGFLRRKLYWAARTGQARVAIADPFDLEYLNADAERMTELARQLEQQGLARLEGEHATATDALLRLADEVEGEKQRALEALEAKHSFERG